MLDADYPALRYIAQVSDEGYFSSLRSRLMEKDRDKLVLTFEDLLRGSDFAGRLRQILTTLGALLRISGGCGIYSEY